MYPVRNNTNVIQLLLYNIITQSSDSFMPGGGGAVIFEMDTGVRPALRQAGAFGESTGSKNEGSLGESMIFGIRCEKNPKI